MITMEPVKRLSKDIIQAAYSMDDQQARYLVDSYYLMQDNRIRAAGQVRALTDTEEPNSIIKWLEEQNSTLEKQLKRALEHYSKNHPVGQWMMDIDGIGPVTSAGLLAHIDISKCPTVGHIYSYAGIDGVSIWLGGSEVSKAISAFVPKNATVSPEDIVRIAKSLGGCPKWLARRSVRAATGEDIPKLNFEQRVDDLVYVTRVMQGHDIKTKDVVVAISKRPFNADLKTLLWKIGESFVKVSNKDTAFYGHLYAKRKEMETLSNDMNQYSEQAASILKKKNFDKTTDAYKAYVDGKLPKAHIHQRAKRYAVKRFLSDLHAVWYWLEYNRLPGRPYAIEYLGHAHFEVSPTLEAIPDLYRAMIKAGAVPANL